MAEVKTKRNNASVAGFLATISDTKKRQDSQALLRLMRQVTGRQPRMWGPSIIGFGSYHYKYDSGREGDWFLTGFSPRKQNMTVYIMPGFDRYPGLIKRLGRFKTGKACLYFRRLEEINREVLKRLIAESVQYLTTKYG
jgi:hypothetical protein